MIPHPKNKELFFLVNINNFQDPKDDRFINAFGFSNDDMQLECKSIFFLMNYMNQPVPAKTIKKF